MKFMLRLLTSTAIFVGLVGSAYAQTGTAQTATQLNTEIGSTLATGSQITALQLRQVLVDVVASSGLVLGNPTAFTNGISVAGGAFAVSSTGQETLAPASGNAQLTINPTASNQASLLLQSAGVSKWQLGKQTNDTFFLFDVGGNRNPMTVAANGVPTFSFGLAGTGFSVDASGNITVTSCTGCGSGSGTVNSGTAQQLAWYAGTGTAVSGNANATVDSSGNIRSNNQMALLNTYSANNGSASLVSSSDITGVYTEYMIILENIVPAAEDFLILHLSSDGGNSFVNTSYFSTVSLTFNGSGIAAAQATSGVLLSGATSGVSGNEVNSTTGYGLSGEIYIYDPLSTAKAKLIHGITTWMCCTTISAGDLGIGQVHGMHNDISAGYNAFRVTTGAGGNIKTGTMRVYGIK